MVSRLAGASLLLPLRLRRRHKGNRPASGPIPLDVPAVPHRTTAPASGPTAQTCRPRLKGGVVGRPLAATIAPIFLRLSTFTSL